MSHYISKIKANHIIFLLAISSVVFATINFNHPPLFNSLDSFALFAQEEIKLEQGIQVSSGNLGSNNKLDIQKDVIINGNLFADEITIDKNTTINGNVSFNKLKTEKETKILGTQTKPVSLPIVNLPDVPDFQIGTQDFKFEGQNNTLATGNYRDITLEKGSRLTLSGETFNLRKLELKEKSTLVFNVPTTLNIQFKLKGQKQVSIFPGQNLKPTDLVINYLGIRAKNEKEQKEDDDDEIYALHNEQEKKDYKAGKIGRLVVFGKDSFLNFKLIAPKAAVPIGESSTLRGQILARKVKVGKGGVVSRETIFTKESDSTKIVMDSGGNRLFSNEIVILFTETAAVGDIQQIVNIIGGRITGIIPQTQIYKIEINTITAGELDTVIKNIKNLNSPIVSEVGANFLGKK